MTRKTRSWRRRKFNGCLPDGTVTTDMKKYVKAWRGLADAVIKNLPELDLSVLGYEPGILFARGRHQSLNMDTELCRAIAKLRP